MYIFYIIYTFIIIVNLLLRIDIKNYKKTNTYVNKKRLKGKIDFYEFIRNINISFILIDLVYYILLFLLNKEINIYFFIIDLVLMLFSIIMFFILPIKKDLKNYDFNELNQYINNYSKIILYNAFFSILLFRRVGDINSVNVSLCVNLVVLVFILMEIGLLVQFLVKNKKIVCFSYDEEEDFIENIHFYKKIEIKQLYNYVIYIFVYILLIYCQFPFAYIGYGIILVILVTALIRKVKKIFTEKDKLYKNVAILKNKPGLIYAFEFERDIEFTKNFAIVIVLYVVSIIVFYILGEIPFTFISIQLYGLIIYEIFKSKRTLINILYSLDERYIDKKVYSVEQIHDNFEILEIYLNIFCRKQMFHKIVYIDNNKTIYESSLILYDPEMHMREIKLYMNPINMDDYVIITEELYL